MTFAFSFSILFLRNRLYAIVAGRKEHNGKADLVEPQIVRKRDSVIAVGRAKMIKS